MVYADYQFYTTEYYGNQIQETEFPALASLATDYIRAYTKGISDTVKGTSLEQVKKCTCALADIFQDEKSMNKNAFAAGGVKTSETVGPWSRGYSSGLTTAATEYLKQRRVDCLWLYLSNLPEFESLFQVISYRCKHEARKGRRHK